MVNRRGLSVVAIVTVLCAVLALIVFAYQSMWRSSSRNLFAIQERGELINLARSALCEAQYLLQNDLDVSKQRWFDWCTSEFPVAEESFPPTLTQQNATAMSSHPDFIAYKAGPVKLRRMQGVALDGSDPQQGIIEFEVTVEVERTAPRHRAELTLLQRHAFMLSDDHGPFGDGGRRVDVTQTPVATALKE